MRGAKSVPLIKADERLLGRRVDFYRDWITHCERDSYWREIDGQNRASKIVAPVLMLCGWYDPFLPGQLRDFEEIRRAGKPIVASGSRLIIGPWKHASEITLADGSTGENFRLKTFALSLPWFDEILEGKRTASPEPAVKIFMMGKNQWRDEADWPLTRAKNIEYYLSGDVRLHGSSGAGSLSAVLDEGLKRVPEGFDSFEYDPSNPVPTAGGATLGTAEALLKQNEIESRPDVLTYTTSELLEDTEVTGPVTATLYVSSTAASTDFTAKLVDVRSDGIAFNVTDGIQRVTHADFNLFDLAVGIFPVQIKLWPTSMVFLKGHKIRLEISSSNFPRFDRNPNTGELAAFATRTTTARQKIFYGKSYPSRVVLPVIPEAR